MNCRTLLVYFLNKRWPIQSQVLLAKATTKRETVPSRNTLQPTMRQARRSDVQFPDMYQSTSHRSSAINNLFPASQCAATHRCQSARESVLGVQYSKFADFIKARLLVSELRRCGYWGLSVLVRPGDVRFQWFTVCKEICRHWQFEMTLNGM